MKIQFLSRIKTGAKVNINSLHMGVHTQRRLYHLGLTPGVDIYIVHGEYNKPYLVEIGDIQFILNWDIVKNISVISVI